MQSKDKGRENYEGDSGHKAVEDGKGVEDPILPQDGVVHLVPPIVAAPNQEKDRRRGHQVAHPPGRAKTFQARSVSLLNLGAREERGRARNKKGKEEEEGMRKGRREKGSRRRRWERGAANRNRSRHVSGRGKTTKRECFQNRIGQK